MDNEDYLKQHLRKLLGAVGGMVSFGEFMRETGLPDFQHDPAAHHLLMIEKLEAVERGDLKQLMFLMPPGSAKSTYASIWFPLYYWARHKSATILCASNTSTLAEKFSSTRRDAALTDAYKLIASPLGAKQTVQAQTNEAGGTIACFGIGSSVTGWRSNLNVLDDPIRDHEQASSIEQLDKQWNWYNSAYRTRRVPGAPEIVVSTRWAPLDIPGRLISATEKGKPAEHWDVVRLPLYADSDDDPLGRKQGEVLWQGHWTKDDLALKRANPIQFATLEQQTPLNDEGSWLGDMDAILIEDSAPEILKYKLAIDMAWSENRGDHTVFAVCGIGENRHLWVLDIDRFQLAQNGAMERLFAILDRYPLIDEILCDNTTPEKNFFQYANSMAFETKRTPMPFVRSMPTAGRDKEQRAATLRGLFQARRVHILRNDQTNAPLISELMAFPASRHDDQVDALALAARALNSSSGAQSHTEAALDRGAAYRIACDIDPKTGVCAPRLNEKGQMYLNETLNDLFEAHEARGGILSVAKRRC